MKPLLQFGLCCLLAQGVFAANEGGGAVHGGGGGHSGVVAGRNGGRGGPGEFRNSRFGRFNGYGYGLGYYGDYLAPFADFGYPDYGYNAGYNSAPPPAGPGVVMVYPPSQPIVQETAHPVIHEYGPSDFGAAPAASAPPPPNDQPILYLIAFKDGTIRAAMTYWVDSGAVHYLDTNHKERQAPLASVNGDLSVQLNHERNVPFSIQ